MTTSADTICALATPAGRGGVSVIRLSGPASLALCRQITGINAQARTAHYSTFRDAGGDVIDFGLSLYFPAPHSFTGEDVCEFQTHGSPVVVDRLLATLLQQGARLARPGEFSERAFLNDKLDLTQAEAIADLIGSTSTAAAKKAIRSLQGEFSRRIHALVAAITHLRVYVEAAIDFPDEEVDFLDNSDVVAQLAAIQAQLDEVLAEAARGVMVSEGIQVVIAGEPNAGKSTLLNALSGMDTAIVTDIPGTTRDILRQDINVDGLPLHIVDTAGLRESSDIVEREGMRRARAAIDQADLILLVVDARTFENLASNTLWQELRTLAGEPGKLTLLLNKIDLLDLAPSTVEIDGTPAIRLSAKAGQGLDLLRQHLLAQAGFVPGEEGGFIARRRHLDALHRAQAALVRADEQLRVYRAGELLAEELRQAQNFLGEITGTFTSDDLLGAIFSSFCIGK